MKLFLFFFKMWEIRSHMCTKPTWIASAITIFFLVFYFLVLELVTPGSYILKQNKKQNATYQEATIFITRIQEHSNLFPVDW